MRRALPAAFSLSRCSRRARSSSFFAALFFARATFRMATLSVDTRLPGSSGASGMSTVKVLPRPSSLSTCTLP